MGNSISINSSKTSMTTIPPSSSPLIGPLHESSSLTRRSPSSMGTSKRTSTPNQQLPTNTFTLPAATFTTTSLLYHTARLFNCAGFVRMTVTSGTEWRNYNSIWSREGIYKKEALAPQFERAIAKPRKDCLLPSLSKREGPQIPLVVTYSPTLPSLSKITQQHHHILHLSERTKQAFPQPPIVAYCRTKNLRDLLVRADLAPRTTHSPGNTPCGRSRCKTCSALTTTDTFTSHCTGKIYTLRTAATCKSRDVV